MLNLAERLTEIMAAMQWQQADLMKVSGQSSSVVSQWLGKGSKEIKTIGKMEAALRISEASGFSVLWIAKGVGPKRAESTGSRPELVLREATRPYLETQLDRALRELGEALAATPVERRRAVADNLAGWALDGGAEHWTHALRALLQSAPSKLAVGER